MAQFLRAGDTALVMEFGKTVQEELNQKVKAVYDALTKTPLAGVRALVPTFRSLLVEFDPAVLSQKKLQQHLEKLEKTATAAESTTKRIVHIPVCYGEEFGADFLDVLAHTGLTAEELILRHSKQPYLIYMLGFLPGFAYLGGLDKTLHTPRLQNPRTKIEAGAVGIGGEQTGIYPLASPGGWRLIGKTPVKVYDPLREEPFLYRAGDYIQFCPIQKDDYLQIEKEVKENRYVVKVEEVRDGD